MIRKRPSVFIGSSSEGEQIAKTLQVLLDHSCEVTIWSQGVFGLSKTLSEKSLFLKAVLSNGIILFTYLI